MTDAVSQQAALALLLPFWVLVGWYAFTRSKRILADLSLGDEMRAVTRYSGTNTDNTAETMFINLLQFANKQIEVFDDGNKMEGSIYESEAVVQALDEKLKDNTTFVARFFFNDNEDLRLSRHFETHERVKIYAGAPGERPPDQTHYKLIDGGLIAHLSTHGHGQAERSFEVLDCRKVRPERLPDVYQAKFGKLRKAVHDNFPAFSGEMADMAT